MNLNAGRTTQSHMTGSRGVTRQKLTNLMDADGVRNFAVQDSGNRGDTPNFSISRETVRIVSAMPQLSDEMTPVLPQSLHSVPDSGHYRRII